MEVEFHDLNEFLKWARRVGKVDMSNIDRRLALLREHGVALGMPNVRRIDAAVWELRSGKYRLYFVLESEEVAVVLTYGDKDTQQRDIRRAQERAR